MRTAEIARRNSVANAYSPQLHERPDLMRGTIYERKRTWDGASRTCASGGLRHKDLQRYRRQIRN